MDNTPKRFLVALGLLLPALAPAAVPVGQPLPTFTGTDLTGAQRHSSELSGQPAVVIAATSRAASDEAKDWALEIGERTDGGVRLVNLLAIDLPFFISEDRALGMAREQVPRAYWEQTWLGGEGAIQDALRLEPDSEAPYVFTLDARGRITSAVRGDVHGPEAQRLWRALEALKR